MQCKHIFIAHQCKPIFYYITYKNQTLVQILQDLSDCEGGSLLVTQFAADLNQNFAISTNNKRSPYKTFSGIFHQISTYEAK